jgi:hypothetical protein
MTQEEKEIKKEEERKIRENRGTSKSGMCSSHRRNSNDNKRRPRVSSNYQNTNT